MCLNPDCHHLYECAHCHAPCLEDEVEGCADCLPGRIEDTLATLTGQLAEAIEHIDDHRPVRIYHRTIIGTEADIVPTLLELFMRHYNPDFDEKRERLRLREVPR